MGFDRFVYWKDKKPTREELVLVLEDYLGGLGHVKVHDGRVFATLVGKPSFPFKRIDGFENRRAAAEQRDERWFEVVLDKKYADVITRQMDEVTGVIAKGFAELLARFWDGELEKT